MNMEEATTEDTLPKIPPPTPVLYSQPSQIPFTNPEGTPKNPVTNPVTNPEGDTKYPQPHPKHLFSLPELESRQNELPSGQSGS